MTTNELTLARVFRDAGFDQAKAEAIAQAIFDAIRDNVATKSDVQLSAERLQLSAERLEYRLTWRGLSALIASLTILFAALHLWPPHSLP